MKKRDEGSQDGDEYRSERPKKVKPPVEKKPKKKGRKGKRRVSENPGMW